jgi:hypothetical protein
MTLADVGLAFAKQRKLYDIRQAMNTAVLNLFTAQIA